MTDAKIAQLIEDYATPEHIIHHCQKVARVAVIIAEKLIKKGQSINITMLKQACLLHDLVRVVDFTVWEPEKIIPTPTRKQLEIWENLRSKYAGFHHADAGKEILESLGEKEIAHLVEIHKFDSIWQQDSQLRTWEEKLIYYADKRVKHDQIVSLDERLRDGYRRHVGKKPLSEEAKEAYSRIFELEKEIFADLDINPEDLNENLF